MEMETATLKLPKDLIDAAIKHHVRAAFIQAFNGKDAITDKFVSGILNLKVDSEGKPSRYDSKSDKLYINYLLESTMKKAIKEVMEEEIEKYKVEIKKSIADQLKSKNSPLIKTLVESMCTGMINAAGNKYYMNVSFSERD